MIVREVLQEVNLTDTRTPNLYFIRQHKLRFNAFHYDMGALGKRGDKLVFHYRFYTVEKLKKLTNRKLTAMFRKIPVGATSLPVEEIHPPEREAVIVYGAVLEERRNELEEYLSGHGLERVQEIFADTDGDISYPELQKALFFAQRMRCPLLFLSVRKELREPRFLDLLGKGRVRFSCVDFPWFCLENLHVVKAATLYGNKSLDLGVETYP